VAVRLGAVDDVVASERLDERGKGRAERPADRGPRTFERRESRDSAPRARAPRAARSERVVSERSVRAPRNEDRARTERTDRTDRPAVRAARGERSDRPATRFVERSSSSRLPRKDKEAVVSFFNDSKGFGFASDDKGDDLFIHFSNIQGDGFKSLSQGQTITFEEATGPKGREARNVRVVGGGRQRR